MPNYRNNLQRFRFTERSPSADDGLLDALAVPDDPAALRLTLSGRQAPIML